ncbi:hypothetical protein PsorP6_019087 [Peronosclerospora sorghi]|nr:hypothetical protein PsorP6_019087 [Peronosclerospora sorghi]
MYLGTVKKKLEVGVYKHMEEFVHDVRLKFQSAMQYNSEDQDVYILAKDMLADFNGEMRKLVAEIELDENEARAKESWCRLCGVERMMLNQRFCIAMESAIVASDKIATITHPRIISIIAVTNVLIAYLIRLKHNEGRQYNKNELSRKKNDDVHEEPWVQCDKCERWVHQICDLFNGNIDSEKIHSGTIHSITTSPGSEFLCPECLLDHRKKEPKKYKVGQHAFSAKDLQSTKLSDFLERRIAKSFQPEREDEAKWTQRDVKDRDTAEVLTVRLVSNIEKQLVVRDKMFQRYKGSHKYTSEHRFKSKCIYMFQELDGVSVLLFGMYVHEFDDHEVYCNSRRPPHLRTKVYHELLIAYFDFVKRRGFHTAHLWACPPLKAMITSCSAIRRHRKPPKSDCLRA